MTDHDRRIDRLTDLARKVYAAEADEPESITVTTGFEGCDTHTAMVWVDGEVMIDIDVWGPRALDALEAALHVLADEPQPGLRDRMRERVLDHDYGAGKP
jgi:hypothetical protein